MQLIMRFLNAILFIVTFPEENKEKSKEHVFIIVNLIKV